MRGRQHLGPLRRLAGRRHLLRRLGGDLVVSLREGNHDVDGSGLSHEQAPYPTTPNRLTTRPMMLMSERGRSFGACFGLSEMMRIMTSSSRGPDAISSRLTTTPPNSS